MPTLKAFLLSCIVGFGYAPMSTYAWRCGGEADFFHATQAVALTADQRGEFLTWIAKFLDAAKYSIEVVVVVAYVDRMDGGKQVAREFARRRLEYVRDLTLRTTSIPSDRIHIVVAGLGEYFNSDPQKTWQTVDVQLVCRIEDPSLIPDLRPRPIRSAP